LDHQLSARVCLTNSMSKLGGRGAADEKRFMSVNKVRAALPARYISTRVDISVSLS